VPLTWGQNAQNRRLEHESGSSSGVAKSHRFLRSPAGLGEAAHSECIIARGHLDLDPDESCPQAALLDAVA